MKGADREKEFMRMYERLSDRELARYFGVPVSQIQLMIEAVRDRAAARERPKEERPKKKPRWTEDELMRLRELYPDHANIDVARALGRTEKAVVSQAYQMGVRKTPERLRQMGRDNVRKRWER